MSPAPTDPLRIALNFRRVDPTKGGAETYVADLCRRLVAAGHRVDLYAEGADPAALDPAVGVVPVPAPGSTRMQRLWNFAVESERALRRAEGGYDCTVGFINTWHHDVIIPQGGVHGASLDCNARRFPAGPRRWLYRLGKRANPKAWIYDAIERRQYDPAQGARVVAVSAMVRGHLERYRGVDPGRVDVIPNAIDADRLAVADPAAARAEFRRSRGIGPDELVALFVGHNYALKGLGPLLRAMRHRLDRDPTARPIRLVACGGGRPARFLAMARDLGLGDAVDMPGFLPDIRPAFHAADFFASPSYYDPCSLVVFEALACGLPVITAATNGAGEVMTPGVEGFVAPEPDAIGPLADALDSMADDPKRLLMADAAAELGRRQSFDRHVGRLVEVFRAVAERKRRSATRGPSPRPAWSVAR